MNFLKTTALSCYSMVGMALGLTVSPCAVAECVSENTCYGVNALPSITTGDGNSAFGYEALFRNSEGFDNSAFGRNALHENESGERNVAVGTNALYQNTTGRQNTAVGTNAAFNNQRGISNTAIGYNAFVGVFTTPSTSNRNTAVGTRAMEHFNGSDNTAMGFGALGGSLETRLLRGSQNTAIGKAAMFQGTHGGSSNTAVGASALSGIFGTAEFNYNTAIGEGALRAVVSANYNTATGWQALSGSGITGITGNGNTAHGAQSLKNNSAGEGNTASGFDSLLVNTTGNRNTAIGVGALRSSTTGVRNTALGAAAGRDLIDGSDNIFIGAHTFGLAADDKVIRLGSGEFQRKIYVAGISGVKTGLASASAVFVDANGQLGTMRSSRLAKEDIQPIGDVSERVRRLRPVTFRYREAYDDGTKPIEFGLIAEEVAEVFPELAILGKDGQPESVAYHLLPTLLLNELQAAQEVNRQQSQQLAQQADQLAELDELKHRVEALASMLAELKR